MQTPDTRISLLLRLQDPSQDEAWKEFVAIYEPLIYRLARAKGLQHADAEDMTQEVFAVVGRAIDRFDPDSAHGSFRGWLFRITRNLVINFLTRGKEPHGTGDTNMQILLHEQPTPNEPTVTLFDLEYQREVFQWAAQQIRNKFQDETWTAFWKTGVEGQSVEDVAKLLGKSTGAIRVARCRVLARLRDEVKRFQDPH